MTTRCPDLVAVKQAQIINPPPPCFVVGTRCMLICCIWFFSKHLRFGLVCPMNIVPEVLWLVQTQLFKPKLCSHVLLREKRLSSGTFLNKSFLFSLFNWTVINFYFVRLRFSSFLSFFAVSLCVSWSDF